MTDWNFKPRVLEAGIEEQVVAWAENNGWLVRKMKYIGREGCPDRFFFGFGTIVMIEFKKPKGPIRPGQVKEHERLEAVGLHVFVHSTVDGAIETLRGMM